MRTITFLEVWKMKKISCAFSNLKEHNNISNERFKTIEHLREGNISNTLKFEYYMTLFFSRVASLSWASMLWDSIIKQKACKHSRKLLIGQTNGPTSWTTQLKVRSIQQQKKNILMNQVIQRDNLAKSPTLTQFPCISGLIIESAKRPVPVFSSVTSKSGLDITTYVSCNIRHIWWVSNSPKEDETMKEEPIMKRLGETEATRRWWRSAVERLAPEGVWEN